MTIKIELPDDWRDGFGEAVTADTISAALLRVFDDGHSDLPEVVRVAAHAVAVSIRLRESDGTPPAGPLSEQDAVRCYEELYSLSIEDCSNTIEELVSQFNLVRAAATVESAGGVLFQWNWALSQEDGENDARDIRKWRPS